MRRYAIVTLLGISLLFAALPFAGAAMFQQDGADGNGDTLSVPVLTEERIGHDAPSAKSMTDPSGCPFAPGQEATQF